MISQAPVLLRLAFHDAATFLTSDGAGGANASLRFELGRPENFGLNRGWKVVEQAMQVSALLFVYLPFGFLQQKLPLSEAATRQCAKSEA